MRKSLITLKLFPAIIALLGGAVGGHAGLQTWDNGSGDFTWNAGSINWSGAAWTAGNDAVFGASGAGAIAVSGTQAVGTGSDTPLTFNTAGYTLTGGTLALPGSGYTSTLAVNANATISALIASGGTLLKTGSGTLTLSPGAGNTNTAGSLTTTAGGLTLGSGTLNVTASGGVQGPGLYVNGGTLTVAGGTMNATAGNYATINNNGTLSVNGGICNINNSSELLNGYGSTGTINVSGTGVLSVNVLRISQGTGIVNLNGGTLQLNRFNSAGGTGTVNFNGSTVQAKSATTGFTPLGYTYNVQTGGAIFDTAGNNITIAAPLTHDGTLGAIPDGGLTKQGAGKLTLTGTNTYTGPTTVNAGILSLSQPMLSADSAVFLVTNTILNLNFAGSNTVLSLVLDGIQMPAGTYNATNTPAYFTGAGSLISLGGNATANLVWTGAGNNNWDTTTTNWSSLGAATTWSNTPGAAHASFGTTGAGPVNLTQAINANSLTFNAAGYTLAGNTLTLGTNAPNVILNANATIASVLTNRTGLALAGTGTLTLSGANTFAGEVAVTDGNLVVNHQRALGFASATVANGSQISIGLATTYTNALTMTGSPANGALQFNGGTAGWSGPVTLAGGARIGGYAGSGTYTLSGGIGGTGDLEIWAGGSSSSHVHNFTISAPCSYTGNTLLNTYAACPVVILSGGANRLPTNTVLNLLAGIWNGQVLSATLKLNGNSQALAGLASGSGVFGSGGSNSVVNGSASTATLTVNCALNSFFDGYLGGPGANQNNFGLTKNGAAELTINRTCTCAGAIAVKAGMLKLPGGLDGGPVTVTNGATLLLGNGANRVAGLTLSASSTLGVNLGATNNPNNTTLQINGNLVLAGTILVQDLGDAAVSNALTVINYTGTLLNLGMTTDPRSQWNVQVDAATPGKVKLIPLTKLPAIGFTAANQTVSNSLQLDLQGMVHGFPTAPVYYEVRTPDNRLWDFGAMPPTASWTIHLRHLRTGTNNVRVFTLDTGGALQQDTRQVVLQLATNPPVRPRPYPAEIWWGGVATGLDPDYGYSQLVDPTRPWNFVKQYQDGIFLHGILPTASTLAQLATAVASALGRFGQEDGYYTKADTSFGVKRAASYNSVLSQLAGEGISISFRSTDFQPGVSVWPKVIDPGWCQNWPNWTHAQLLNSNMQCWTDFVTILHTNWPGLKLGMTWSPVYFNWNGYPCTLGNDALIQHPVKDASGNVILNQYGTNAWFDFDMQEFFLKATATANLPGGDGYFGFASDCPYDYFAQWSNAAAQATNQAKIFAYENWERTNGYFPTTICNYSHANSPDTNVWDQQFTQNSFTYLLLKQQLGGRTQKYLFESWYSGPYTWAPESNTNSFSGMVKQAIKYLKGIQDTNGTLEQLNLALLSSGATNTIELRNDGDITCLPAVAGYETGAGSGTVTYYNAAGSNITALVLSAEGYVHTNRLAPGQTTTIRVVTSLPLNRTVTLEAFWNPQDPTGVVRDRLTLTPTNQPPMLNPITNRTLVAGQTLMFTNVASDADVPAQTLTFSLLTAPDGMTLNATNGRLTWRPAMAQAPTTNPVSVVVTDNGTPPLSATQSCLVTVTRPAPPAMAAPGFSNGIFSLLVAGTAGPDYILQTVTNLNPPVVWLPLQTNLAATPPFTFTDPGATGLMQRFYRVLLGP